jgi:hypothetical protein
MHAWDQEQQFDDKIGGEKSHGTVPLGRSSQVRHGIIAFIDIHIILNK